MMRTTVTIILSVTVAVALAAAVAEEPPPPAAPAQSTSPAATAGWELVGSLGRVKTVYVDPARIKDKALLASAVKEILDKSGRQSPVEINFFDERETIPRSLPFPPETRAHLRARFNFNPANGLKRFVWIEPADPNTPQGKPRHTEDSLPLE